MTMQFFGVLCGGSDFRQIKEFRGKEKPQLILKCLQLIFFMSQRCFWTLSPWWGSKPLRVAIKPLHLLVVTV